MTFELTVLVLLMLLAASMWIPYIIGVTSDPADGVRDFTRPIDMTVLRPWVHRAHRAHLNLLEQALPFAVIVLVAHLVGVSGVVTIWAAGLFLVLRLVHAVGMISGYTGFPARSIIFNIGWLCILAIGWQVLAHG